MGEKKNKEIQEVVEEDEDEWRNSRRQKVGYWRNKYHSSKL